MSIPNTIDLIEEHIENAYDALALGGADLTNVNKNLTNINSQLINRYEDYLANGTDVIWNNWEDKSTQEGETLNFNNTIEAKANINLKGNIKQNHFTLLDYIESTGTQYIDTLYIPNNTTRWELDFSFNDANTQQYHGRFDNTVSPSGQRMDIAIGSGYFVMNGGGTTPTTKVSDTLRHKFIIDMETQKAKIDNDEYDLSTQTFASQRSIYIFARHAATIEYRCNGKLYSCKFYENDVLVKNLIPVKDYNNVICLYDTISQKFFYNKGTGVFTAGSIIGTTPIPDIPQNIQIVTGNNILHITKKNLFNPTYQIENQYNASGETAIAYSLVNNEIENATNVDSGRRFLNKLNLKAGTYTVSGNIRFNNATTYRLFVSVRKFNETNVDIKSGTRINIENDSGSFNFNFTLTEDTRNIAISLQPEVASDGTIYLSNLQLEKNDVATIYEPYQEQAQLISLGNIELAKIGDYTDKIFKAIEGDNIYDNLDNETKISLTNGNWYKQNMIGKFTPNGQESTYTYNSQYNFCYLSDYNITPTPLNNEFQMNTAFQFISTWKTFRDSTTVNATFRVQPTSYRISIRNTALTSAEQYQQWLAQGKLTYYYQIETPIYTQITDTTLIEQLENLKRLKSYNNQTNILQSDNTDLPFIINVTTLLNE